MEIERALQQLELLQKKLYAYHCADSSLYLDAVTTAPSDTSEGRGDLTPITAWLREKVHQYGGLMEPADVVKNACGDFSAEDYLQYLTRKYTELYGL